MLQKLLEPGAPLEVRTNDNQDMAKAMVSVVMMKEMIQFMKKVDLKIFISFLELWWYHNKFFYPFFSYLNHAVLKIRNREDFRH